jgi:subtilisin-like proprotein convertase family protein
VSISGGGTAQYNVHNISNTSSSPTCVTFTVTTPLTNEFTGGLHIAAFRQPFVAADIANAARYSGSANPPTLPIQGSPTVSFQTIIPANTSIAVVVYSFFNASTGTIYTLDVTSTNGAVGSICGIGTGTKSYTGAAVPIPDNVPTGVNETLPVSGIGRIRDMNFLFQTGGICDATVNDVDAAVSHTFIGDLTFKLTSPKGTAVTFQARRGGTRENICSSSLDDEFNNPLISALTGVTGSPQVGTFQPETTGRMSSFKGENADGNWTLNVSDNLGADTGSLRRFGLQFTDFIFPSNDFDNDGLTDISVFRPSVGEWYYRRSNGGVIRGAQFGSSTDKPVPGDYTGDGQSDLAFFRPSTGSWFILRSEDSSFYAFPFGVASDIPSPGDFDGDGKTDVAVFRPSTGIWYINNSASGTGTIQPFGASGDIPVVENYDGDAKDDIAIFRPSNGEWYTLRSSTGVVAGAAFGNVGDKPVQGDYTGDGKADFAIWRPSTGFWFVLRSEDFSFFASPFGAAGDIPAPGDYDGDGRNDQAVFRPSNGVWYINRTTDGVQIFPFGASTDIPVPAYYLQ